MPEWRALTERAPPRGRSVSASGDPSSNVLVAPAARSGSDPGQVALAGADDHVLLQAEVAYHNPAALDLRKRAVTAVDDLPHRAANRGGGVPAAGAVAPPGARAEASDRGAAERGARALAGAGAAAAEARPLEPQLGQPPRAAGARLQRLEDARGEGARLQPL